MTDATGARHPSNIQALKMAFELSSIEDIMRAKKYIVKKHTICLSPRGFVGSPQVRSCLESKKKCAQGVRVRVSVHVVSSSPRRTVKN